MIDYQRFYAHLYAPLETSMGRLDPDTLFAVIGFDCGGPLNLCTIGAMKNEGVITYVSCELAVRESQQPSSIGRYELLCTCDDASWAQSILTRIGQASLERTFGPGHTIDLGVFVNPDELIQGVILETAVSVQIESQPFGILRVIGITRDELDYKLAFGSAALIERLKAQNVYPNTFVNRASVV